LIVRVRVILRAVKNHGFQADIGMDYDNGTALGPAEKNEELRGLFFPGEPSIAPRYPRRE
jgi:hypothetical protein